MCGRCGRTQHRSCIYQAYYMQYYECPQCQLEQVEPCYQVTQVLLPASLVQTQGNGVGPRSFPYTKELHDKIINTENTVQLRSVRLDKTGFVSRFPRNAQVIVNGGVLYTTDSEGKFSYLTLTGFQPNTNISIQILKQRNDSPFAFAIFVVTPISNDQILANFLQENRELSVEQGRRFIQSLSRTPDLMHINFRLSLNCPLTQQLPSIPVRGQDCKHIQCFDLEAFVLLQELYHSRRWSCPVCGLPMFRPVKDLYYQEIVNKAKESKDTEGVFIRSDGQYELLYRDDFVRKPTKRFRPRSHLATKRAKLKEANHETQ